jgi:hypothetical protein
MKKILMVSMLVAVFNLNLEAKEHEAVVVKAESAVNNQGKVIFCARDHKRTVLKGKSIELLNIVLTELPMSAIRMFKAAVSAKKVLSKIEEAKAANANIKKDKELEFIKTCLGTVLDPVRDFFIELKAYKDVIGDVFKQSLGENADKGLLVKSLKQDDDLDIMKYLLIEITSIDDLESATSEFLIFFSDVEASLTDEARQAYAATLVRLKESQKNNLAAKANSKAK